MKVNKNTVVSLSYIMRLDDAEGEIMESIEDSNPFIFLFTEEALLPRFEKEIEGLEVGAKFDFTVSPEEAYGVYAEDSVVELPKEIFHIDGRFDEEGVKEGVWVPLTTEDGQSVEAEVTEVGTDTVTVDFNHELAGATLNFQGEVLAVRMASKQEVDQGFSTEEEEEED
jgi:FKBP-type peptidyl-prolyl cis-trans isomerase SlyD